MRAAKSDDLGRTVGLSVPLQLFSNDDDRRIDVDKCTQYSLAVLSLHLELPVFSSLPDILFQKYLVLQIKLAVFVTKDWIDSLLN